MFYRSFFKSLLIDEHGRWKNLYYILIASPRSIAIRRIVEKNAAHSSQILDIGSRKSPYTRRLKRHITCLDKASDSDGYLGFTQQLTNKLSELPNIEVVYGDVLELPFTNETYDMVLCIEVIEHIDNDEKALCEISRVMKRGGQGLFTTPNGDMVSNINPYHIRHYSPGAFSEKLRSYFDEVTLYTICPWPKWCNLLFRLLRKFEDTHSFGIFFLYSVLRVVYLLHEFMVPECLCPGMTIIARVAKPKYSDVIKKINQ